MSLLGGAAVGPRWLVKEVDGADEGPWIREPPMIELVVLIVGSGTIESPSG